MQNTFGPGRQLPRSGYKQYAFVAALILVFFGGWYVGRGRTLPAGAENGSHVVNTFSPGQTDNANIDFNLFWQVWNDVKKNYVKQPVDETTLFYGAMRGMMAAIGDPYSDFFDPKTAAEFDQELSGTFSGIGVEIGKRNGAVVVIAPLDGGPGAQAGLKSGDIILAIDKHEALDIPLDQAVSLIRGEEGTTVELTVLSKGAKEPRTVAVKRQKIEHTGLRWSYEDGIAVVKLNAFDNDIDQLMNNFIRDLETHKDVKGIVLDLRNDPGGYLEMAIEVASEWIEDGIIVRERDNTGTERQHQARGRARLAGYKTVILVNEGSASAAEIVAGALQDTKKATLVGKTTFGKGSVQKYESLEDGSAFKLTVAQWFTPDGRAINEVGIKPDIEVDLTEADFNADRDPQMLKAIELLK